MTITSEKIKRNQELIALRKKGKSYNELAKYFNITPQRVVAIVKKNINYLDVKKWRENNPEKIKAQRKVFIAVRNGTLKKEKCFCGEKKTQCHHEDYNKPLEVIWFCKKHHMEADIKRRNSLSTGQGVDNK